MRIRNTSIYTGCSVKTPNQVADGNELILNYLEKVVPLTTLHEEPNSSSYEMCVHVLEKCFEEVDINPKDIDILIYTSNTPTSLMPTTSAKIVGYFNMQCMFFDMNANCAGMLVGMNLIQSLFTTNPKLKHAIIVGCDYWTPYKDKDKIATSSYGDTASAMLLDNDGTYIPYNMVSDTSHLEELCLPRVGLEQSESLVISTNGHVDLNTVVDLVVPQIKSFLKENGVNPIELKAICASQGGLPVLQTIANQLGVSATLFPWVGGAYGYTGVSCVPLAFSTLKLMSGDKILLWSLGAGIHSHLILYTVH